MSSWNSQILSALMHAGLIFYVVHMAMPPKAVNAGQGLTVELVEGTKAKGFKPTPSMALKDKKELISKPVIVAQKKIEKKEKPVAEKPKAKTKDNKDSEKIITQKDSDIIVPVAKKVKRKKLPVAKPKKPRKVVEKKVEKAKKAKATVVSQETKKAKPSPPPTARQVGKDKTSLAEALGSPNGLKDARQIEQLPGNIDPTYPLEDKLRDREGTVALIAYVTADGRVEDVRVEASTGSYAMNQASVQAFYKYRFVKNRPGWVRMPYEFQLVGPDKSYGAR